MTGRKRIYYLGMITTDAYAHAVNERTYSGAAARKMILVARAMRSVGLHAIVVSLPFVGTGAKRAWYGKALTREAGVPAVFVPTLRSPLLRKIIGPFLLASFVLRRAKTGDKFIFYNHAIEYIPSLLLLRLRGIHLVQDIEDAPTADERGLRGVLNRISFAITFRLTKPLKMVVADHVAKSLKLEDYVVIRGVAAQEMEAGPASAARKWDDLRDGGPLRLHFGGTLIAETGVGLFCEAVTLLTQNANRLDRRVEFKVTGVGDLDSIRRLHENILANGKIQIDLLPELSKADYLALIDICHGSLSLKEPGSNMSNTTFPSKVIEITASGLALVSTPLGDVPSLFGNDAAYFLSEYTAKNLVDIFIEMAASPARVEQVAMAGRKVCTRLFSPKSIGKEMARLL